MVGMLLQWAAALDGAALVFVRLVGFVGALGPAALVALKYILKLCSSAYRSGSQLTSS